MVVRIWNLFWGSLETLFYLRRRRNAKTELQRMRDYIKKLPRILKPSRLEEWYKKREMTWRADPLGGWLDFTSKPWVTVTKNKGDCDDFAEIAWYALKDDYDNASIIAIAAAGGKEPHAVFVAGAGSAWIVMSNTDFLGQLDTRDKAIRRFFGDKTLGWIELKSKQKRGG